MKNCCPVVILESAMCLSIQIVRQSDILKIEEEYPLGIDLKYENYIVCQTFRHWSIINCYICAEILYGWFLHRTSWMCVMFLVLGFLPWNWKPLEYWNSILWWLFSFCSPYFIYFILFIFLQASKKLPCNHIFHTVCLISWFQRQQTGPTCRLDVLRVPVEGTFWDVRRNRPQVCWSFRFACIIEMYFTMNNRLQGPVHEKVELFLPPNTLKKNILVCIVVCWRRLVAVLLLLSTKKVTTCYFRSPHDLY